METNSTIQESVLDESSQKLIAAAERINAALDVAIEILGDIQKAITGGQPKKLKIKLGDKTIAELPISLTTATTLAAGLAAVLITKLAIEFESKD